MENQTRFNLSAALQNWREELAAQCNLTEEMRRELETHVNDTMAELRRRGLNDEESFWLARRRVGQPKELGEEFGKADPATAYREGVLWSALALFAIMLWQNFAIGLWSVLFPPNSRFFWILLIVTYLPVVWLAVSLARGRFIQKFVAWPSLIRSRGRFFGGACFSYLTIKAFALAMPLARLPGQLEAQELTRFFWSNLFSVSSLSCPVVLIVIIVWLLPAEKSRTLKRT